MRRRSARSKSEVLLGDPHKGGCVRHERTARARESNGAKRDHRLGLRHAGPFGIEGSGRLRADRAGRAELTACVLVTRAGALALAETRSMRERLWAGVELRALLRNA